MLMPMMALADSYTSLWKQVKQAEEKDLPRTELKVLDRIVAKAERERAYGHLLKARLKQTWVLGNISPDSVADGVHRLEEQARRAEQGDEVLAAVYYSALGTIYKSTDALCDSAEAVSRRYYSRSLAHPQLLAKAFVPDYTPFILDGEDSRVFQDDLLHVLGWEAGEYRLLHDFYTANGNRPAACICALEILKQDGRRFDTRGEMRKSSYLQSLDSLINVYADLTEAGELAIERFRLMQGFKDVSAEERYSYADYALTRWGAWPRMNALRNAKSRLTLPSFHVAIRQNAVLPDKPVKVDVLSVCNLSQLTMSVRRVDLPGALEMDPQNTADYSRLKKAAVAVPVFTQTRRYVRLPEYKVTRDSMCIDGLAVGTYLVEFTTDNPSVPVEAMLLHVSNIHVMVKELPDRSARIVVTNATTGEPLPKAQLTFVKRDDGEGRDETLSATCDEQGEYMCRISDSLSRHYVFSAAYGDDHTATQDFRMYFRARKTARKDRLNVKLFTDRGLYRPGQTVRVAVLAYNNRKMVDLDAAAGKKMMITLYDANRKAIADQEVTTDGYGVASCDFVLPKSGAAGMFFVKATEGVYGSCYFAVEEYKRPAFTVDFDKYEGKYQDGDTIEVTGVARSYSGVPVQGAKAVCHIVRRPSWWWYGSTEMIRQDTVMTDEKGVFRVRVPLSMPKQKDEGISRYYQIVVTADVTDGAGETRTGETSVPLSDRASLFTCELPEKVEREDTCMVTFRYLNNAGEPIEGQVQYRFGGQEYSCKANSRQQLDIAGLASGKYLLDAVCGADTLKRELLVFSFSDTKAPIETHDWFFVSGEEFEEEGQPVRMQLGASDEYLHVVYDIIAEDEVLESGVLDLDGELHNRGFVYEERYGDGVELNYAWVKDGMLYAHNAIIKKPLPKKELKASWTTFRDKLVPGQKEVWTLHVEGTEGRQVQAQLMATMYDKSLDAIRKFTWSFTPQLYRSVLRKSWRELTSWQDLSVYGELAFKPLSERNLQLSQLDPSLLSFSYMVKEALSSDKIFMTLDNSVRMTGMAKATSAKMRSAAPMAEQVGAVAEDTEAGNGSEQEPEQETMDMSQLRTDFSETAFFYPNLETDEKGNVDIRFTLPQSTTTWQFYGFVHDKDMNSCLVNAQTVARKTVMVQPNVPRFLRSADNGQLVAMLHNTSENEVTGTAKMELLDPESEKVIFRQNRKFAIGAEGSSTAVFDFDMSRLQKHSLVICRITAYGRDFSDGEQHYLPILPDKEQVTNTLPISLDHPGVKDLNLDGLFPENVTDRRLTVEYTENSQWLMVQTLPSVVEYCEDNAVSLSAAFYANSIGRFIVNQSPVIRKTMALWQQENDKGTALQSSLQTNEELKTIVLNETPWLLDAERETAQKQQLMRFFDESEMDYRQENILAKLKKLQNPDGSFSWWNGLPGNKYMTQSVVTTLVRLNVLTGVQDATGTMLDKAFGYMERQMAEEVEMLKKEEKKGKKDLKPSETAVDYLYAVTIAGRKLAGSRKTDCDYLLGLLGKQASALTIYGKAIASVVLAKNGNVQKATDHLQSMKEYMVYKEEMGRYFDTPKAMYSWFDYRIPSQVAVIEAMKALKPDDRQTIAELQQWLLQSKRTQAWNTPINTVNAVYAFLNGEIDSKLTANGLTDKIRLESRVISFPESTAGLGYVKMQKPVDHPKTLTIEKESEGTSWGALYAQFLQDTREVVSVEQGLKIERKIIGDKELHVGDKVKVRITITADRDYDFVQVVDKRAACMEPVVQLSGYAHGYYTSPRDNAVVYCFDRLSKGKHVIETNYHVDRVGNYSTGLCTIQCAYSPEFSARTSAEQVNVK